MTKKLSLLFALMLSTLMASAHDIEVKNADGVTIYYNYINNGTELEVSFRGSRYDSYSDEYQGNVVIPEEVTTYMSIPRKVTSIGYEAFYNCKSLTSVTIPNSVTSIGYEAFYNCKNLTSVTIPNSVTSIGSGAFAGCYFEKKNFINNSLLDAEANSYWDATIVDSRKDGFVIKDGTLLEYTGNDASVTIPNSVTSIGSYAFRGCSSLTSVTIGNSVISIGYRAFESCSGLTSVTIGNSVTSIGSYAFSDCYRLTSVTIGNSVTSIGSYAFRYCSSLTKVTLNSNAIASKSYSSGSTLGNIFGSQVNEYVLGDDVTSIGSDAFYGCSGLTSVTIPNSVTSIGSSAFSGTAWYNNQPDGLVYAGLVAYKYKGTMPENTSIIINEGTLGIGEQAFYNCYRLTSITIPNSVTSIGSNAFRGCSKLADVYCYAESVPNTGGSAFQYTNIANATLIVPASAVNAYKTTVPWSEFGSIVALPEPTLRGDVNGDGEVNMDDATFVTNIILGTEEATEAADVNKDGEVNMSDVMFIINYIQNGKFPDGE